MLIKDQVASVRLIESPDDFAETRLEAIGYVFHGTLPKGDGNGKKPSVRAGTNILHFARCAKLEKASEAETKFWFRTISVAKEHLDETVGPNRWKWCKICEREITQRLITEQ